MKCLYIGQDVGTSSHRHNALRRLGHDVNLINPYELLRASHRLAALSSRTGFIGWERLIERFVVDRLGDESFDFVWVDNGELVGRSLAKALKSRCGVLINHNLDNPFSGRDGLRWRLFLNALPAYDLFVTPRLSSREAASNRGAQRAVMVRQAADEVVHRRRELSADDERRFGSEVVFVGTWMPERGPFMRRLLEIGVPLRIFGTGWRQASEYQTIASRVTVAALGDDEYAKAISGAKIALTMLSEGNMDLHTTRSLEIPAIGTLLCGPRSADHEFLYRDGEEACFFEDADSCAQICFELLADEKRRKAIAAAGHRRAIQNGRFNEAVAREILAHVPSASERKPRLRL